MSPILGLGGSRQPGQKTGWMNFDTAGPNEVVLVKLCVLKSAICSLLCLNDCGKFLRNFTASPSNKNALLDKYQFAHRKAENTRDIK